MNENENKNDTTTTPTTVVDEDTPQTQNDSYIRALRDENASHRQKLKDVERENAELKKFRQERERADLEAEKRYQDIAENERKGREDDAKRFNERLVKAQTLIVLGALKAEAIKAGIRPEALTDLNLLDIGKLSLSEDDSVEGTEDFVTELKTSKPHWFVEAKPAEEEKPKRERAAVPPTRKATEDLWQMDVRSMTPEQLTALEASWGITRI